MASHSPRNAEHSGEVGSGLSTWRSSYLCNKSHRMDSGHLQSRSIGIPCCRKRDRVQAVHSRVSWIRVTSLPDLYGGHAVSVGNLTTINIRWAGGTQTKLKTLTPAHKRESDKERVRVSGSFQPSFTQFEQRVERLGTQFRSVTFACTPMKGEVLRCRRRFKAFVNIDKISKSRSIRSKIS